MDNNKDHMKNNIKQFLVNWNQTHDFYLKYQKKPNLSQSQISIKSQKQSRSNLKQSLNFKQDQNYCQQCQKVITNDELIDHIKNHPEQNQNPIEKLECIQNDCIQKIENDLQDIESLTQKSQIKYVFDQDTFLQRQIQQINDIRDNISLFVNNYFDEQVLKLKNIVKENTIRAKKLEETKQSIFKSQNFLNQMREELIHNQNIDHNIQEYKKQSILDNLKIKIQDFEFENQHLDNILINTDFKYLTFIKVSIKNYCNLKIQQQNNNQCQNNNQGQNDKVQGVDINIEDSKINELHYFKPNSKSFYYWNVQEQNIEEQQLKIDFLIPENHKSIKINDIYLIGGQIDNQKSSKIYILKNNINLMPIQDLIKPRSNFAICQKDNIIYLIGGLDKNDLQILDLESYDIQKKETKLLNKCKYAVSDGVCIIFKNSILKFGGQLPDGELCQAIEIYDIDKNIWSVLNPKLEYCENMDDFRLLKNQAIVQINSNSLYIFGGQYENDSTSKQSFIFESNENDQFIIKNINQYPLHQNYAFTNNQNLIYKQQIYSLLQTDILNFNGLNWDTLY